MKKIINTAAAPAAIGPYSQAVEANGTLYISGQIPLHPESAEIVGNTIEEQTEQVMKNIESILKAAGYTFNDVVKSTCLLANIEHFQKMNEVYGKYYKENPPARAAYQVVNLPKGVLIEIETTAVK
ncbi:MAG: RidA family protein [Bacteroidales bacterium]|nr:RidA family protein [Bacteroidales bacterium]